MGENDILSYWRNANPLKLLEKIASNILSIPVSSATSERVFSTSGNILNEGKTRLLSSYLEKLLFLNKNM